METVTVSSFIAKVGITADIKYVGFDSMPNTADDSKLMDHWKIEMSLPPHDGMTKKMTVDYWTGIGHRKYYKGFSNTPMSFSPQYWDLKKSYPHKTVTIHDKEELERFKPYPPKLNDVLDCLISEAMGFESAPFFEDWAGDYGYSTDSRQAEKVFNTVAHQTSRLKKFLGKYYQQALETERM